MAITKKAIGRLVAGDEIVERRRGVWVTVGIVAGIVKNVPGRYITVSYTSGGGYSQNWAAKVWVKS